MSETQQLLSEYVQKGSETAFTQLTANYVDLVYSAAVRLVNGDAHLAQDVTQIVFADLARKAHSLSADVMLGGWLHRHTCFVAANIVRGERRRQARERESVEMNAEDHSQENLAAVAPILDEAINELTAEDRTAIMLRYFERHDFEAVGQAMQSSEEAARKRVNRALDKLHALLTRRGVALSVAGLGTGLSAEAVTAAPVGMAAQVAATALATAATGTATSLTILKIMSMTKLKVGIATAIIVGAGAIIPLMMQHRSEAKLRADNAALRQEMERLRTKEAAPVVEVAAKAPAPHSETATNDQFREVLRLRGEISRLRQQNANVAKGTNTSTLGGLTSDPEMWKTVRNQQKMGLAMAYGAYGKQAKLTEEQKDKLGDLLADNVMENIDLITAVLRDGKTADEAQPLFDAQDASLQQKVQALLGDENVSSYKDYTHDMLVNMSVEQFKSSLTGDKAAKASKASQLVSIMKEETASALVAAGLSPDFQTTPMLNFRNIAYEKEGEKSLQLMAGIYERTTTRAASFLTAKEMTKLKEFTTLAINNNRMALTLNRKLMAPGAQ